MSMIRPLCNAALALTCVSASLRVGMAPARAAEVAQFQDVVVSARGSATRISRTPGGVGVIPQESIFLDQPVSLSDTAARLPGISLSADGPWGGDVVIRGLGRNRIVFLVDSCRINTATDINAQFGLISPYDIERIEVLKGPISALYGSGSIGGVVNVITREAAFSDKPEIHGTLINRVQSNPDGFTTYGSSRYSNDRVKLFVSAGRRNYQNYENADGDPVHSSQFDDWHLTLQGGYRWDAVHTTEVQYRHYEGQEIGVPGRGLSLPAAARTITYPETSLDLLALTHSVTPEDGALVLSEIKLFWELIDRRVTVEDFPPALPLLRVEPEADHETWGARWLNVVELQSHTLSAGLDAWLWEYSGSRDRVLRNGMILTDTPLADSSQLSAGLFAEDDWRLAEDWVLNLGGRVDRMVAESEAISGLRPEDTYHDVSWNAHAGLTWDVAEDWSMTLIGASSYRAPDLLDRFKVIDLGAGRTLYGTPDLDPERSLFAEYGVHYRGDRVKATASTFVNRVRDLIVARPVSPTREEMQNVSEAELYGAEVDVHWFFAHGWQVYANAAWVEGEDRTADEYLRFTPPLNGLAGLRFDAENGLWTALETEWYARQDHTPPGIDTTDAWARVDLLAGYRFDLGRTTHDLLFELTNLLDSDYEHYLSTSRSIELKEPGFGAAASWKMTF